MVVGSYLITCKIMRIKDERGIKFFGPEHRAQNFHGRLTPSASKERAKSVFQMVPEKMKNLVIVNSALTTFDMIQACVEVADEYSENVAVIPPLLALITYAIEDLSKFRNPPPKEVLLIVTITSKFFDFVILNRDETTSSKLHVAAFEHYEILHQCKERFLKAYNYHYPHATIFLVQENLCKIAEEIKIKFNPENCIIKLFKKWDFILLFGGLIWAMNDQEFDSRYHIDNFSSGYETTIQNRQTLRHERHILLPERSALPCNIHGFDGIGQRINMFYSPEYYQSNEKLISLKRSAIENTVYVTGSSKQIIGYVDERGIPSMKELKIFKIRKAAKMQKPEIPIPVNNDVIQSDIASTSDTKIIQQPSSANADPLQIKFIFRDNFFAVEVLQNGISRILENSDGNEWTPLYLSTADGTVEIGEKAKQHFEKLPKYVIYDVLKIIGKPLNEIKIDQKWGFELINENGIVYFQIETLSGPRLFSQEIVIAAFLKTMKLQTESFLDIQIKKIRLSTNFKLNDSQKAVFEKAAAKNNLEILCFGVL